MGGREWLAHLWLIIVPFWNVPVDPFLDQIANVAEVASLSVGCYARV